MQKDLVAGLHVVRMLLERQPDRVEILYYLDSREDKRIREVLNLARLQNIATQAVPAKEFDRWFPEQTHQGVAARVKPQANLGEHELLGLIQQAETPPFFLVLEGVQDPHNFGACLRTAEAAGVHAVIVPKDRSSSLTPVVRKAASGAADLIPIVQVPNLNRCLNTLKKEGVWLVGAALEENTQSLYDIDLTGPIAFVLGSEGTGLRRITVEACDMLITIPMQGRIESLNVSVAAGICLFEALRQRISK